MPKLNRKKFFIPICFLVLALVVVSLVISLPATRNTLVPEVKAQSIPAFPGAEPNPYDLSGDGQLNAADVLILLQNWENNSQGDFNSDGKVNSLDSGHVIKAWGL